MLGKFDLRQEITTLKLNVCCMENVYKAFGNCSKLIVLKYRKRLLCVDKMDFLRAEKYRDLRTTKLQLFLNYSSLNCASQFANS